MWVWFWVWLQVKVELELWGLQLDPGMIQVGGTRTKSFTLRLKGDLLKLVKSEGRN